MMMTNLPRRMPSAQHGQTKYRADVRDLCEA